MNWKKFLVVFVNAAFLLFPYNIIGCAGGDADPYDYYVSFFSKKATDVKGFEPFYYTSVQFLYEENGPEDLSLQTSAEWVDYGKNSFSEEEARRFVVSFARKDLSNLYFHLEKGQPLQIPDSVAANGMTKFFQTSKDLEALGYLMYAKQVEPFVTGTWSSWEPIPRDQEKMGKLIKNAQQLYAVAKSDFIKLRLAYQLVRLSHYSNRYAECIRFYEELVQPNKTPGILHDLSLSLKAGALMRTGKKTEAAYLFSKVFSKLPPQRVSNYMSFDWSVNRLNENTRTAVLTLCKNDKEKADLLGLFALGSTRNELPALKKIAALDAGSSLLKVLVVREINKLEENYLTPLLHEKTKGKRAFEYYEVQRTDSLFNVFRTEASQLAEFCQELTKNKLADKNLYSIATAHILLIKTDYAGCKKWLNDTKKASLTPALQDQWAMTNLLLTINSAPSIDKAFEENLYNSIQWLDKKATTDEEYAKFFRRLFADVLAARYVQLTDQNKIKYLLCIGAADQIHQQYVKDGYGYYSSAKQQLRHELTAPEVEQLIALMESGKKNSFEKYLVKHNSFSADDVNDVAGTTWMRQFNWAQAEKWLSKVSASYYQQEPYVTYLAANPFADLMLDTHAPTEQDTVKYTKLSFARKMMQLEKTAQTATDPAKKANALYSLANGYYQMSYWGNSWMLVQYEWGSSDGMRDDKKMTAEEKEYYGVFRSEEYYMKAFTATNDREMQALCLFMAAKCQQKQIPVPSYMNMDYDAYKKAQEVYNKKITVSKLYFPRLLKEYEKTALFNTAYGGCSYFQDFVNRQQKKK